jgi:hypothetical protein
MDFIIELPESEGYTNIVVVIDYLSKGVVTNRLNDLEANIVAKWFVRRYFLYYFLPFIIVSDRGI